MADRPAGTLYRIIVWSYDRGTLPYDVLCALILAFIFLVPRSCFLKTRAADTGSGAAVSQSETRP